MKVLKLYVVIITVFAFSSLLKSQPAHNPGGVTKPAYWLVASQANESAGLRSQLAGDTMLIPYSSFTRLNFNPSLLFAGKHSLSIPLDKKSLNNVSYFTVYQPGDTSRENVIWHTVEDDKTNLVLTTNRMADLSPVRYMNYTDVVRGNPKINIYFQQSDKSASAPLRHTMMLGAKPASPQLPVSSFTGNIPEIIIYNRILSGQEQQRVSSYLALKYGITLSEPDAVYLNSGGQKIWEGSKYSSFHHNIAGICRDDSSGLIQSVSESGNTPGLLTVAASGQLADKNYLLWGDNGLPLQQDDEVAGMPLLLQRKWLFVPNLTMALLNTDIVIDAKQLDVPLPAKPVYWLAIDSSEAGIFSAGSTVFIKMSQLDQQSKAHFTGLKWTSDNLLRKVAGIVVSQDLLLVSDIKGPVCNPATRGSMMIRVLGGSPPFTLSVTGNKQQIYNSVVPDNQVPVAISNLSAGGYILRVTDAAKHIYTDSFYMNYTDAPKPYGVKPNYDLHPHEKLDINAAGPVAAGVSYVWTGPNGFVSLKPAVSITEPGAYTLTTSQNGCAYRQEMKVNGIPDNVIQTVAVYPNSSSGRFTVQVNLYQVAKATVQIYASDGRLIKSENLAGKANYVLPEELSVSGIYEIVCISGNARLTGRVIIRK